MKKLFFILLLLAGSSLALMTTSCEDECTQEALCSSTSSALKTNSAKSSTDWSEYSCGEDKYYVCHNGETLCIGGVEAVQNHLDHGDTLGECQTLSSGGLVFRDGEVVSIPCKYELPLIHVDENGRQWIYTVPNQ